MNRFISSKKILILIIALAAILRLWHLDSIPPHLTSDEASLGYNAYSILKTGRDEYGKLLPIVFKSFGDYKPGLYVYTAIPSIALFGLNEFAVRLPSALAGILTVIFIYFLVNELGLNISKPARPGGGLALIAGFLAAINPWLIQFSRGAWEANLSLTLTLIGIYLFLKSKNNAKLIIYSVLFFSLTLLAYQGAKLSTGIVFLLLVLLDWKELLRIKIRYLIYAALLGLIVSAPILLSLVSGQAGRLDVFSIFSYRRPDNYLQNQLGQSNEKVGDLSYYLYHTEIYNFVRGIAGRWFNHFSGRFLFFEGDWQNPRHTAPNSGEFLVADLILLVIGFVVLSKNSIKKENIFILLWLILAPLPSALSRDSVHAIRSLNMAVPLIVISAIGLNFVLEIVKKVGVLRVTGYFFLIFYFLNFIYYLDSYFVHLSKHDSQLWEYGYKQVVQAVTPIQNNYKTIKVQQSFAQPYIYFLFYQKYDPAKYQKAALLVASEYKNDVGYITKLDNIEFTAIDWSVNRGDHGDLIIGDPIRIPPEDSSDTNLFKVIKEIKYLDGQTAFRLIEVK